MSHRFFLYFCLVSIFSTQASQALAEVAPSQVLVLYNADWRKDHPLTDKGQDSKEIAEHYVNAHTHPETGEKPYILGLSGKKGRSLGTGHLDETSRDNRSGVILTKLDKMIGPTHQLRDSRLVEFTLPENEAGWRWDTFKMQVGPLQSKLSDRLTVIENGQNRFPDRILVQETGEFNVRLNGLGFLSGSLQVNASCADGKGETHRWEARYNDPSDLAPSTSGPDAIRDDGTYLDLIETPVKAFLEDPANALPDGTPLKDHILFFVICHGLPRTCIAPFGIERGITQSMNNFGPIIDLGQRLQLMYYNLDRIQGILPRPYRFETNEAFTAFYFRSPQALPLYGSKANPFLHPETYQKEGKPDKWIEPLAFTPANRKKDPDRHLYFAMRIDAPDPVQAKNLIDRAVYAGRYAAPDMGVIPGLEVRQSDAATGRLQNNPSGTALWDMGFKRIFYQYTSSNRLELFRLPSDAGFYNTEPVYLPGGIAATVTSESGWNRQGSAFYKYFNQGVTVTLAAARVYEGAPHIHNKSWWDDTVFYQAFTRGRTIGEVLLMNQTHLGWVTAFIGDPLYRLPSGKDRKQPPVPAIDTIRLVHLPEHPNHIAVSVRLKSDPFHPQAAQLKLAKNGGTAYICPTFESNPFVLVEKAALDDLDQWQVFLMDPFGREIKNRFGDVRCEMDKILTESIALNTMLAI